MIIMENPSPLFLGQEFVRQYYLLLNKNPDMMHRLYRSNSSYVHGEFDPNGTLAEAVYGQKEIYEKIKSLQFSECHTNIRHVAAHAILNDGIVVQVLGDLSNSGQPMRTFRQTLVLVPEVSIFMHNFVHLKNNLVPFWFYTTFINVVILFLTEQWNFV
uniref:NTF2 domain-containing protein n=1 Tax=Gouania willdenowi TaxID=441366 RepID=A0A8C5GXU4_GOUWI